MNPCPSTRGLDEGDIDEAICGCGCARRPCHHHDWRQHGERRQVHRHEDQSHRREGEPPALCSAKEATKGIAAVEPDCDNKAMSKFQPAYDKPGACGNPSSSVCEAIADDCQTKVRMALPDGDGTNPSPCESKRLKAAGKKASRKLKCYAKAAAKGLPVDSAPGGCLDKASMKFMAAFIAQSGCTGDGNETGIETLIDNECVNQLVMVDGMGHVIGICAAVATSTTTTKIGRAHV